VNVVILVPRREGFEDRDALWAFCRPWWQHRFPGWPLIEGHHMHGLFNRSAALNQAATLAGDWDVAVIIDSDVLCEPAAVREAVRQAHAQKQLAIPFATRKDLSARGTAEVMAGFSGSWEGFVRRRYSHQVSSVLAVSRRLWDDVGGFDEGFAGWGLEDTSFALACETIKGKPLLRTGEGEAWHLYHKPAPEKHGSLPHHRNMARSAYYRAASSKGDKAAIRALVAEGRQIEAARMADAIPRILHRVVPDKTPAVAEAWWERFRSLHPGWRLMTHRDPLDPAEWPLTSPHWAKCASGAQLAGLVRLEALLRFGGVYVDMDVEPFRALDPLLGAEVFAAWEDERVIPDAVLGARPDHHLIRACLTLAISRLRKGAWESGPGVTTKLLRDAPEALLLPPGAFYDVSYQDPERDQKMRGQPAPWSFVRHWYAASWLPADKQHPLETAA
jgi:hypothetical protein